MKNTVMDTFGRKPLTTAKILCNKLTYGAVRSLTRSPQDGWLHSPWHWYRSPFSLRNEIVWSAPLQSWFLPEDESAMECMLRLPSYEPVSWVAPKLGDIFIDIGAYIGWYTIQASRAIGANGRVVALEPDPSNRRQLERNIRLNQLENCALIPLAAWSRAGDIGWQSSDTLVWHKVDEAQGPQSIEVTTVDFLVGKLSLPHVDWIKLDIEGGEVEALKGAEQTLRRFHPKLFIEVHETLRALKQFLETMGYVIEKASFDQPFDHHGWILARRP